ncbi:hypothetical protein [Sandaracinus amylolyticus]|uniref:hypothetical protein n=1 Tax=Sandaracinus amylolyticus TaxID=927083 RepID=UPI001F23C6EE|nr:hypothetical protein [Sandaracinus amylolyticus]UJR81661.1 Hypothetical protein I5071_37210 [Sandaracinus amylolyticus]
MSFFSKIFGRRDPLPRIVAHTAFDGAVRVIEAPTEDGWDHAEDARRGDGFTAMVLRYVRIAPPEPLALLAKIYTLEPTRDLPEDPRATDWRAAFGPLFATIESVEVRDATQLTMKRALPAIEALVNGIGTDHGTPLRIRERRSVAAREQLIVTAMGSPRAFQELGPTIDRWFETSAFAPLADG